MSAPFRSLLIGNESLTIQAGTMLREAGHEIAALVSRNPEVRAWAEARGIALHAPGPDLAERLDGVDYDWLLSVANLDIIPERLIARAARGAVNFHDGPLPRYAGLNAPVWALLAGETRHGISWHMIEGGIDEGDIVVQRLFDIAPGATALDLNSACYSAAIDSFGAVIAALASGQPPRQRQDLSQRSYFGRDARPRAAARLDFSQTPEALARLVSALDHGGYANPLARPKILADGRLWLVGRARPDALPVAPGTLPGTVLAADEGLTVAAGSGDTPGAIRLEALATIDGAPATGRAIARPGTVLASLAADAADALDARIGESLAGERHARARFDDFRPATLGLARATGAEAGATHSRDLALPAGLSSDDALAALAVLALRLGEGGGAPGDHVDLAWADATTARGDALHLSGWVPVRLSAAGDVAAARAELADEIARARRLGGFPADLPARLAGTAPARPAIGLGPDPAAGLVPGTLLTLGAGDGVARLWADATRLSETAFALLAARVETLAAALADAAAPADLPILPEAERQLLLQGWNATAADYPRDRALHRDFEALAAAHPDLTALVFETEELSYGALNARANRAAHVLRAMGVGPGTLVGLHTRRSPHLLVGALAILKAGGAYVPLDPAYPAERIALYIEDSAAPVIVTESALAPDLNAGLNAGGAASLVLDADPRLAAAPETDPEPETGAGPEDLAYLIYTSGSTGRPKGVMIEHRNVMNFFAGMDARIPHDPVGAGASAGTWLAVTSLSFDISVLELFWTLARGFTVVLIGDESRALVSDGKLAVTGRGMEFSLFYWGNDDGVGRDKYKLLFEGAKFADRNGFVAVWTPERHFHAFGGPYPNPSVTGAAVAALTTNLAVRAGSCVAPLHHPARIAEEWAVIDNLTNGRTGLGIASGWQPHDFALRPENTPPHNKPAMLKTIDQLRRLWAGEEVAFPLADGTEHALLTQPRPVSKTLQIWLTTAGNPDTWIEAGKIGANVLTHLLGQSIDEVAGKIRLYHDALREAGHDPADFTVTLMLHTFLGADRETVRDQARGPMKAYLASAAALIKQFAWAFPAFKRPKGVANPFELDLGTLSEEELDAILEFAFLRYFEDSGLFGTVEDALDRVEELKRIGVDEIACLIDYGIERDAVIDGLTPLAEVLRRANADRAPDPGDVSIAAQIVRHGVTHMQCTPSMARMLVMNDEARHALGRLRHILIGGEALPGSLVAEIGQTARARITNMYGPTETTIWSTTEIATADTGEAAAEATVPIGKPIANTRLYILDEAQNPVPAGQPGELWIGGEGVARGYWQRPELTADRFRPDPFHDEPGARIYRTGDLVRARETGTLDFLGRIDHQVKLRGYRIELGEIEAALEAIPGIRQAVVIPREDTPGLIQLVAYLTGTPPAEPDIRKTLARTMPEFMVPARTVTLEAFPLTPNKKVDRKALPKPKAPGQTATAPAATAQPAQPAAQAAAQGHTATGDTARTIAEVWAQILGVTSIAPKDNFFELGGHSLLAVQAHREIKARLKLDTLSIADIFGNPTLAGLAEKIETKLKPKTQIQNTQNQNQNTQNQIAQNRQNAMQRRKELRQNKQNA